MQCCPPSVTIKHSRVCLSFLNFGSHAQVLFEGIASPHMPLCVHLKFRLCFKPSAKIQTWFSSPCYRLATVSPSRASKLHSLLSLWSLFADIFYLGYKALSKVQLGPFGQVSSSMKLKNHVCYSCPTGIDAKRIIEVRAEMEALLNFLI